MTADRDRSEAEIAASVDASAPPVHWPALTAQEAEVEWPALRDWVQELQARFPHTLRLPECWWRHNDLVELLAALRDYERASYAPTAAPSAAMDWHRAFREFEVRAEIWVRRFACSVPGREHPAESGEDARREFLHADLQRRAAYDAAAGRG